jgi:isoleucyl-tRNA synthetase
VARRVERAGIEAWQSVRGEELIGAEAAHYEKSRDTLDVWFDSGSTHYTVLRGSHKAETGFPAHLYLEGSDQHRGWFHSSLLVACMLDGIPPYKALLTHGFVVDGEGRKMSKSKGNVIAPQQVSHTLGAEILRLWVASTDYSGELFISNEILKHVVESYRRVRNTLRFLLANTSDFDAARHAVPVDELLEIDRYALAMTARVQEEIAGDYERYQFHLVAQKLQAFCSEDLSAFFLDILKDRLYTCKADSLPRRSAQTALHHITHSLVRLMAPILSFTAEELWQVFAGKRDDSVFFQTWHALPRPQDGAQLLPKWERLRELRDPVRKKIEELRAAGQVGSSLQAEVDFHADGGDDALLRSLGEDLKFVMLTSAARVHRASGGLRVEVAPSLHRKCERCWHYRPDVDDEALCGRCRSNLHGPGEKRRYA